MINIVFSRDRAMQLHAFLTSYRDCVMPLDHVYVLVSASTNRHATAYREVFASHDFAVPHWQVDFKRDLLEILPHEGCVTFFVDDQIFIRPWSIEEWPGLSLRLAPHLTRCYTMNVAQPVPEFEESLDMLLWCWADGQLDWSYPISVDGHVFEATELRHLLESIQFSSPNTLEAALQSFVPQFQRRRGACYRESRVVNVPWNRVQTDWANRSGDVSPDSLLALWEDGLRVHVETMYGVVNESVHQEFPLVLVRR